ncbi:dienelactone hydrolase family protein [Magnetospira sp. QH-2]|uniref:dienelactone hydrolase family protein n=1 Tax=Magnetospira sp. (strain QH-2) TaxID=1288970 RepID=UPI0003E81634|nr:dienelactone hydrolase family protein [Magnetospira sp. QH-2]CCQ72264.1 carboxymethylenebutenolidase (Dienelactone hydrolase) (DLH) [Magnetospira sp. QH-2]
MSRHILLTTADGHTCDAYLATPNGETRGALVVVQEIFGVNGHIRDVCDRLADQGWTAIAPALQDRIKPGTELDYDEAGIATGREMVEQLGWDGPMLDIAAAAEAVSPGKKVGVTGFCWGGSVTFLSACRVPAVGAAVGWYGRHIPQFVDTDSPQCPVMMHFGMDDPLIPADNREAVAAAFPDITLHQYEGAGHGFNCDRRPDYREQASRLAWERSLAFFAEHL